MRLNAETSISSLEIMKIFRIFLLLQNYHYYQTNMYRQILHILCIYKHLYYSIIPTLRCHLFIFLMYILFQLYIEYIFLQTCNRVYFFSSNLVYLHLEPFCRPQETKPKLSTAIPAFCC